MECDVWSAFVDGSSTTHGSGAGIVIITPEDEELQFAVKFEFKASNNEAEYEALIRAMQMLSELGACRVLIYSDSQLVTQQVLGAYERKSEKMVKYAETVERLRKTFVEFRLEQIPRERNSKADCLAKLASSAEGSITGKVTLLMAEGHSASFEVGAVEGGHDWRNPIIHFLKTGERKEVIGGPKKPNYAKYCLIGGRLFKRAATQPYLRCLSREEGNYVLREIHEGCAGSHSGARDVARKVIRAGYYWPTLEEDARAHVKKCDSCQRHGPLIHVPAEKMGAQYAACPFDKWGIDLVGKLPTAPGGRCYLLVAVDYFSKWVEAVPLAKIDEANIIKFLWRNICCRFGIPRVLVSDNGTQFFGSKTREWCERMKIQQKFTSVAHPQANGQVEVTNRTLLNGIKARLDNAGGKWIEELESVLWSYRTSPKTATGESPFTLVYGAEAVVPAEIGMASHRILTYTEHGNAALRKEDLDLIDEAREGARRKTEIFKMMMNSAYNKRVRMRRFHPGDLVLRRANSLKPTGKLEPNWEGPFIVAKALPGGAYEIKDKDGKMLPRPWNVSKLKKYYT